MTARAQLQRILQDQAITDHERSLQAAAFARRAWEDDRRHVDADATPDAPVVFAQNVNPSCAAALHGTDGYSAYHVIDNDGSYPYVYLVFGLKGPDAILAVQHAYAARFLGDYRIVSITPFDPATLEELAHAQRRPWARKPCAWCARHGRYMHG